jgi:superfamily II DNA or RNA helicase
MQKDDLLAIQQAQHKKMSEKEQILNLSISKRSDPKVDRIQELELFALEPVKSNRVPKEFGYTAKALPEISNHELCTLPDYFQSLRKVQNVMFTRLREAYVSGVMNPCIVAPTGAGKTIWAAMLFRSMLKKNPNQRLVFFVPRINLLEQTYRVFQEFIGSNISIIQGNDPRLDFRNQVYVSTVQTISRRMENSNLHSTFGRLDFGCAIHDEAHLQFIGRAAVESKLTIGLTATPYSLGMYPFYHRNVFKTISSSQLAKDGDITPLEIDSAVSINTKELDIEKGEYNTEQESLAFYEIRGDVLKNYEANAKLKGLPFLGFAKRITVCEGLAETFTEAGYKVGVVHSKMSTKACEAILSTFKAGLLDGVFSVVKLTEGFDYPAASVLLMCTSFAPSKEDKNTPNALARFTQMIGRVRRKFEGKTVAYIQDHGDNFSKYSIPDKYEDSFTQLSDKKKPSAAPDDAEDKKNKERECPKCSNSLVGKQCTNCGHISETLVQEIGESTLEVLHGEMVSIDTGFSGKTGNQRVKHPNLSESEVTKGILYEFEEKNRKMKNLGKNSYKEGWMAHKYKELTGSFPTWGHNWNKFGRSEKSKTVSNWILHTIIRDSRR